MCKHQHSTPVLDNLEDGTPVIIHQCDMCGLTVWRRDVAPDLDPIDLPPIDLVSLEQAFTKIWRDILTMP